MPRAHPILTNFTAGELSPRLAGRTDLEKYYNGCETLENMVCLPHGGATRRFGTEYVSTAKTLGKKVVLVPFEFSTLQAYVLEFGHEYIRFYKDRGVITSAGSTYEITSPYPESALSTLKFAQTADVMYLVHKDYAPRKLSRTSHATWTLAIVDFEDGPYRKTIDTKWTSTGTTGAISITTSADLSLYDVPGKVHGGVHVRLLDNNGNWNWAKFNVWAAGPTATHFSVTTQTDLSVAAGQAVRFGAFTTSAYDGNISGALDGFPGAITLHEQRLVLAGTTGEPQAIWGSVVNDYESFSPTEITTSGGPTDEDSYSYTLAADKVNALLWMVPGRVLQMGTNGGEWRMGSTTSDSIITPTNVFVRRETTFGSEDVQAVPIGHSTLFIQQHGRKLREIIYNYEIDGFQSLDLTLLAEHITENGKIISMAYQEQPDSVLWFILSNGLICGLTFMKSENVIGFHRHPTAGSAESVTTIPGENGDEVWLSVKRTVGGVDYRFIEVMANDFVTNSDNAFFLDCGLTYESASTATSAVSGMDHLIGKTCSVLADGATHPDVVIDSSGRATLVRAANVIHIGLPFTSTLKTMRFNAGAADGTAQARKGRIAKIGIRFYRTVGAKYGRDIDDLSTITFRRSTDIMNDPVPLFTGDKVVSFPPGYTREKQVIVQQDQPLPMTILSIMPDITVDDS